MLDSNYTAFEDNIIGAVTRMAFGSPNSQLVYDRDSLHYVVLDVVYCQIIWYTHFGSLLVCLQVTDVSILVFRLSPCC
jgi:hypothetical protein